MIFLRIYCKIHAVMIGVLRPLVYPAAKRFLLEYAQMNRSDEGISKEYVP